MRLFAPFLGLFAFSVIVISGLLYLSTKGQDQNAIETSIHLAEAALDTTQRELANITFETSYWDQAVENLVTNYNPGWAASNMGTYLANNYGVTASFVIKKSGEITFAALDGAKSDVDPFQKYSGGLDILVERALSGPGDTEPKPASGLLYDDQATYSASVVRLTTYYPVDGVEIDKGTDSVTVMMKIIDEGLLSELAERLLLPNLRVQRAGIPTDDAYLPLTAVNGDIIGALVWNPILPGSKILQQLLWGLVGVFVVVCGLAFVFRRRAREVATALSDASVQLDQQSAILQTTLDSIDQGIAAFDADGRLVAWNEQCEEFWYHPPNIRVGMSRLELLEHIAEVGGMGPGDPKEIAKRRLKEVEAAGSNSADSFTMLDGREVSYYRFGAANGGQTIVYLDVTERRKYERELNEAKEQAEAGNRAKSEFIAHVSHELRTPLNAVIGFSEMMTQKMFGELGSEKYDEYAKIINSAGRHLLEQINQVLDLSKIDAGKMTLDSTELQIPRVVEYVSDLIGPQLRNKSHELTVDVPPSLPRLFADNTMLTQVLLNLLSNAIKFTPNGGHISISATLNDDQCISISVSDDGIGIEKEMLPYVGAPFVQIRSKLSRSEQGTGLGLSIVNSLVELHDGDISLESETDKGTTVTVTFPASRTIFEN